ncbi:MAG: DUF488 domain-containing protein [Rhodomicrobium sp.]
MATFYTIGHSTRSAEAFIGLLEAARVQLAIDVRTIPKSRYNPQFNTEAIAPALQTAGIGYRHMPALGGLRHAKKGAGPSPNGFWDNENFRNYADYAATGEFRLGLGELRALGGVQICAIFCAEALWWQCHRRIITDYLLAAGDTVNHIMGGGHQEPARMTEAAVTGADGAITYPPAQGLLL